MPKRRAGLSPLAAVVTALSAASALLACASILDLKELPIAPADTGAPSSDAGVDAPTDACPPRGATYCQQQCPVPDFCDDFEGARLAENWEAPLGFQNPLVTGAVANVHLERDDAGAQTQALFATAASDTSDSANAVLLNSLTRQVAGRKLRGARVRVDVRVPALSFADGGTVDSNVSFMAFGSATVNQGIGIQVYVDGTNDYRLGIQQRALGPGNVRYDLLPSVVTAARDNFVKNYLPVDLMVGTPELLRERKIACTLSVDPDAGEPDAAGGDASVDGAMRIVIQFNQTTRKCAVLRDVLATPEWLGTAAFITGASVSDFGTADLRIDNLAVYLYE